MAGDAAPIEVRLDRPVHLHRPGNVGAVGQPQDELVGRGEVPRREADERSVAQGSEPQSLLVDEVEATVLGHTRVAENHFVRVPDRESLHGRDRET